MTATTSTLPAATLSQGPSWAGLWQDHPDWAGLYPQCPTCHAPRPDGVDERDHEIAVESCDRRHALCTPRQAEALYAALDIRTYSVSDNPLAELVDMLPDVALPYLQDLGWRQQFLNRHYAMADRIRRGNPVPACTADELILDDAVEFAHALVTDEVWLEEMMEAPVSPNDYDYFRLHDTLFYDSDFLLLFDDRMSTSADVDAHAPGLEAAFGVINLHPRDWFVPFFGCD